MDITYFGTNEGAGGQAVHIRHSNGNVTHLKRRIVWHSPDGFQWGYGGSGPADLALNMLYDYLLRTKCKGARCMALDLYQSFKWGFIATQTNELCVPGERIEEWLTGAQVLGKLAGDQMTGDQIKSLTKEPGCSKILTIGPGRMLSVVPAAACWKRVSS